MEVKTQNQISHDSWYKERGHSMEEYTDADFGQPRS